MRLDYLSQSVTDIERDLGVMLITSEDTEDDWDETAYGYGDDVRYVSKRVTNIFANATGFIFNHPHGATIRGTFAKPITVCSTVLDSDGDELDYENHMEDVAKALLAKLGNIAGLEDIKAIAGS